MAPVLPGALRAARRPLGRLLPLLLLVDALASSLAAAETTATGAAPAPPEVEKLVGSTVYADDFTCAPLVDLPALLDEPNEGASNCPIDDFTTPELTLGAPEGARRLRAAPKAAPAPAAAGPHAAAAAPAMVSAGQRAAGQEEEEMVEQAKMLDDAEPPKDCRHEVAVQFLWTSIQRRDLKGNKVHPDARYKAAFFRAPPGASWPITTYGVLRTITLHTPGLHTHAGHRPEAELHFEFEGEASQHGMFQHGGGTAPNFTVIFPIEVSWAWDAPPNPVLTWLSPSSVQAEVDQCGQPTLEGIGSWFANWFRCRTYSLHSDYLLTSESRALYYTMQEECGHTFVATEALVAAGEQLKQTRYRLQHTRVATAVPLVPDLVVVGGMLPSTEAFTVFSGEEVKFRTRMFMSIMAGTLTLIILLFLLVKRCSDRFEVEMMDYAKDGFVKVNTKIDFWLCYTMALAVPWTAYFRGATNRSTGMPYEYMLVWFFCYAAHALHELAMCIQVGGAVRRVKYRTLARFVLMTFFGMLHCELQIQFGIIAFMHGHLGVASIIVFVLTNVLGQLVLFTCCYPTTFHLFKIRGFEALHGLLEKRLDELKTGEMLLNTPGSQGSAHNKGNAVHRTETAHSLDSDDSGAEGMLSILSSVGDALQCLFQISYSFVFGFSPLITGSLLLTSFFLFAGVVMGKGR